ncbi:MAG TPA: type 4a pilus biogenesis protein PilO [Actinomycetota bacterium]|nr:type 4a pilus biogenesis protein PilO [Actinomycetota bacterium]
MNRRAPVIAGIVFALVAILAVVFLVLPKRGDVSEAEERLQEAEEQELVLEAQLAQLREAAEEAEDVRRELAQFRRAVPPVADLPGLINQLQTAADISGVDFFAISPSDPVVTPDGRATQIPATIEVIGGFFPVDEFLSRLESLPRAAKVGAITVAEGPNRFPQLDVTLETLFYTTDLDAGPGAPPPAAPGTETAPEASPSPGASPEAATTPEPVT